ncbi:CBO0543 family protein [Bacillus sp. 31A1R]|uniref:CBO0543 family protein n=1 Tax=Robertmurraya mangrovi TaxID=3098077 RepID=A0ABU5IZ26_9BACI|nr:CBO0543 family protein [Bacillus sp. 31A1R]MDZ5472386.1 CBO0543 family protein [Bacillus sp. 31A1R]
MNLERWILVGVIFVTILAIFTLIPRKRAREAWVLLLFLQVITWPAGLFVVEMGWIEYPIQLLKRTNQYNRTSLTFEFFIFPIVAIIFSLYFPNVKRLGAIIYYVCYAGFFTCIEVLLERTTRLVEYHEWTWYWTLITVIISLFLNHKYYLWYKKKLIKVKA